MERNILISDENQNKIELMRLGDRTAILWGLQCYGLHFRTNAAVCAALYKLKDDEIIEALKRLKSENYTSIGTSASGCAYAALDMLGVDKYVGNSREVKNYLENKFEFYKDFITKAQASRKNNI